MAEPVLPPGVILAATGDDDPINAEEKGDLEYRKAQLKRFQEEVVDIEDMQRAFPSWTWG